jgi:hypothetical protein
MSKRYKFGYAPRRQRPDHPVEWPFEADIVAAARWPAQNWPRRRAAARPIRALAALLRRLAGRADNIVDLVEGQPLIQVYWQAGWERSMLLPAAYPYGYFGDITPDIVAMFEAQPERFAGTDPKIMAKIVAAAAERRGK